MAFRDYMEQVERDAREAIEEGAGWYDRWEDMNEALFIDDAVTGNGSGSYFFDARKAADVASSLVFDDDFIAEAHAAGYGPELFTEGPEAVDVVARCLALGLVSGALEEAYASARRVYAPRRCVVASARRGRSETITRRLEPLGRVPGAGRGPLGAVAARLASPHGR